MNRSDVKGVMVGVECVSCDGNGWFMSPGVGAEPKPKKAGCLNCLGTGVRSKCIPLAEFELMLDRDLLSEPGGGG